MSVIKEWFCSEHGEFESSHAICPVFGCMSADVIREFRTPVGVKSDITKRTDAGLRRTAEMYGQGNFKSAKAGESSKASNESDSVLWGDRAQEFLGRPLTNAHTAQAFNIKGDDGATKQWVDRGGMATAANELGITQRVLPRAAETIVAPHDKKMREQITKQ